MYEEKRKKSMNINWKGLIIKLAVLLVVVFLILWIISLFNKKDNKSINMDTSLQLMKTSAVDYFKGSKLPSSINGKEKLTLEEMLSKKAIINFDENNLCSKTDSYIEATKINNTDYTIKAKLVCGTNSDAIITTITEKENSDNTNNTVVPGVDTDNTNNNIDNINNNNQNINNSSTITKPSNNKPNNSTTVNKPSTNNKPNNTTTVNKPSTNCKYGDTSYNTNNVIAYKIGGACAVSIDDYYNSKYADPASSFGTQEYQKLVGEVSELRKKTNTSLEISQPIFSAVYNRAKTGLVGYKILYTVKQNLNYSEKTIYQYYLNSDGKRVVVIDNRGSLGNNNTTNNNNNSNTNKEIKVSSISLNRSTVYLDKGEEYNLKATVSPSNATNKTVTWSSSNRNVATVSNGRVVAKGVGTATITAKAGGKSVTCKVVVSNSSYVPVSDLVLNKTFINLDKGETYNLSATVYPYNATYKSVSYTSSNTRVATVSSNGKITAKGSGYATITASADGVEETCNVYVYGNTNVVEVNYLTMEPGFLSLKVGRSATLTATVLPNNATDKSIKYTSNNTRVATVSSNGTVTAKSVGTAVITATASNGFKVTSIIDVISGYDSAEGLILDTNSVNLDYGKTYNLKTTVYPNNSKVKFTSANSKIAMVSSTGTITGLDNGITVITASVGNLKEYVTVRVNKPVKGITLNTPYVELNTGKSYLFDAKVTNLSCTPTYHSSNTGVATVNSYGLVTAVTNMTNASTLITASCGNYSTYAFVIVNPDYSFVNKITLNNLSYSLNVGETYKAKATPTPSITTEYAFNWTSSNSNIAIVDKYGNITALRPGTAVITATLGSKKTTMTIYVN